MTRDFVNGSTSDRHEDRPLVDFGLLWRWKWIVVLSAAVTTGLGLIYLTTTQPVYEASARVLVRREGLVFDEEGQKREDRRFLATQAEVVRSPLIIRDAISRAPVSLPEGNDGDETSYVLRALGVMPLVNTDVLRISYRANQAGEAVSLIRAVVDSYIDYQGRMERDTHEDLLSILDSREKELRSELADLQRQHTELHRDSSFDGFGENALDLQKATLRRLGDELAMARSIRSDLEYQSKAFVRTYQIVNDHSLEPEHAGSQMGTGLSYAWARALDTAAFHMELDGGSASAAGETVFAQTADTVTGRETVRAGPGDLAKIEQQLWQVEAQQRELAARFGPRHPDLQAVVQRVEMWRQLYRQRVKATSDDLAGQLQAATARESEIQRQYDEQQHRIKTTDSQLLAEQQLQANMSRLEKVHDSTVTRLTERKLADQELAGGSTSTVVCMLEDPALTETQVWPKTIPLLGLCGILGMAGGCGLVIVLGHRHRNNDSSVREQAQTR